MLRSKQNPCSTLKGDGVAKTEYWHSSLNCSELYWNAFANGESCFCCLKETAQQWK